MQRVAAFPPPLPPPLPPTVERCKVKLAKCKQIQRLVRAMLYIQIAQLEMENLDKEENVIF